MTEFFCNECASDKKKGCTVMWPNSWNVDRVPECAKTSCDSDQAQWRKVTRTKRIAAR